MVVHKVSLGTLQWYWDGTSYTGFDGVRRPKMAPVTLESHGLDREQWWQVPNGSTLARQIAQSYPFFDPVVEGGELVDIAPWPDWKKYGEAEPQQAPGARPTGRRKYNRRTTMNELFYIIEIEGRENGFHGFQGQSGRKECWMEGWIAVPRELVDQVNACQCYCDLVIEDGVLTGIVPREIPVRVPTAQEQIAGLKEQLSATDYKIIKCSEYQLAGLESPYDIAALHAERQALRDQINELEQSLV